MSTFAELLENRSGRLPGDVQEDAAREFASRVRQSRLNLRSADCEISSGVVLILGVASYSPAELDLLDGIDARYDDWADQIARFEVFNALDCHSQQDFREFLPGLQSDVRGTPVLGIWSDAQLQSVVTGLAATRQKLSNIGVL